MILLPTYHHIRVGSTPSSSSFIPDLFLHEYKAPSQYLLQPNRVPANQVPSVQILYPLPTASSLSIHSQQPPLPRKPPPPPALQTPHPPISYPTPPTTNPIPPLTTPQHKHPHRPHPSPQLRRARDCVAGRKRRWDARLLQRTLGGWRERLFRLVAGGGGGGEMATKRDGLRVYGTTVARQVDRSSCWVACLEEMKPFRCVKIGRGGGGGS